MKKLVIFLLINSLIFSFAEKFNRINLYYTQNTSGQVRIAEEAEVNGKLTIVRDETKEIKNLGGVLRVEAYSPLLLVDKHSIQIGAGFSFENPRNFNDKFSNLNYFTPLYFSTLYEYSKDKYEIFGKFNVGYEFAINNEGELKKFDRASKSELLGGIYFGLESGIQYKSYILGLAYNFTSTKLTAPEGENQYKTKTDLDFSLFSLNLGYRFKR